MTESTDARRNGAKSEAAFRTISEVASELDVPQHVLRFWETKFTQIRPMKRGGGRRYYRPEDVVLLRRIRALLYDDGLTIKGVQKLLREKGVKALMADEQPLPATLEKVEAAAEARQQAGEAPKEEQAPDTATQADDRSPRLPFAAAPEPEGERPAPAAEAGPAPEPETTSARPALSAEDRRELEAALAELVGLRDELQAELRRQEAA
ncbi:MerR family transcriptional regulator [Caenispirillum salinarum]|uniref:MerR family transcriptional regulator n=1 Tax=Caenispirillum salinarum TaxID=859058 RepID=UPI00384FEE68